MSEKGERCEMRKRRVVSVAVVAAMVAGLSACGGEDGTSSAQSSEPPASTSSAADSPSPADASGTAESDPAESGGSGGLTPPGTELTVGETATVSFKSGDTTATLAITVTEIERGEKADLAEYGDQAEGMVPYFIRYTVENLDGADLSYANVMLGAVTGEGRHTGVIITGDAGGKCETVYPDEDFAEVGATYETCRLQAAREDVEVVGAEYASGDGYVSDPVVWTK